MDKNPTSTPIASSALTAALIALAPKDLIDILDGLPDPVRSLLWSLARYVAVAAWRRLKPRVMPVLGRLRERLRSRLLAARPRSSRRALPPVPLPPPAR